MAQEIERKFLANVGELDNYLMVSTAPHIHKKIQQIYIQTEPEEIRVRKIISNGKTTYTKTIKKGHGMVREENEFEISFEEFSKINQAYKVSLEKTRIVIDGFEIDFFKSGIISIEREFSSIEEANSFNPKNYPFIGEEITGNKFYSNYNIALRG